MKKKAPTKKPARKLQQKTAKSAPQKSHLPSALQGAFLAGYAECGNVTTAARIAKCARSLHYRWMAEDPSYPERFTSAHQQACDLLEEEARRRAVCGLDKPVFYKGEECGAIREYSDTLLIFLMKGAMPEKYRDNAKIEHTGLNNGPIAIALQNLSDDELQQLDALAKAASQPGRN